MRRGRDLTIVGGGHVRGLDLRGMRWTSVEIVPAEEESLADILSSALPRWARRRYPEPLVFEDCDFSGLRCLAFGVGSARFVRCRFEDVRVRCSPLATQAHVVDCVFSGIWEGDFDARSSSEDPQRRVRVEGNDMRRVSGVRFVGGIPEDANRLDVGGQHLVVRRGSAVHRFMESDSMLKGCLMPFYAHQEWLLLHADEHEPAVFENLRRLAQGRPTESAVFARSAPTVDASASRGEDPGVLQTLVDGPPLWFSIRAGDEPWGSGGVEIVMSDATVLDGVMGRLGFPDLTWAAPGPEGVLVLPGAVVEALASLSEAECRDLADPFNDPGRLPVALGRWDQEEVQLGLRRVSGLARQALICGAEVRVSATEPVA